jgi:tryptophan-rich sensory protein
MKSIVTLALFILLVLGGGTAIGLYTLPGDWYAGLNKPWFNPPNWLFGPAWSVLYILIAIAGWRIWEKHRMTGAMAVWWIGLGVNFMWSPIFFGMQSISLALIVVVTMLALTLAFIVLSRPLDRIAAWLFVPYAAWVSFAALLNASIWWLN